MQLQWPFADCALRLQKRQEKSLPVLCEIVYVLKGLASTIATKAKTGCSISTRTGRKDLTDQPHATDQVESADVGIPAGVLFVNIPMGYLCVGAAVGATGWAV